MVSPQADKARATSGSDKSSPAATTKGSPVKGAVESAAAAAEAEAAKHAVVYSKSQSEIKDDLPALVACLVRGWEKTCTCSSAAGAMQAQQAASISTFQAAPSMRPCMRHQRISPGGSITGARPPQCFAEDQQGSAHAARGGAAVGSPRAAAARSRGPPSGRRRQRVLGRAGRRHDCGRGRLWRGRRRCRDQRSRE